MYPPAGRAGNSFAITPGPTGLYGKTCTAVKTPALIFTYRKSPLIFIFLVCHKKGRRAKLIIHSVFNYHIADLQFRQFFHFTAPSLILVIFLKTVTVISFGFAVCFYFFLLWLPVCFISAGRKQASFLTRGFFQVLFNLLLFLFLFALCRFDFGLSFPFCAFRLFGFLQGGLMFFQ